MRLYVNKLLKCGARGQWREKCVSVRRASDNHVCRGADVGRRRSQNSEQSRLAAQGGQGPEKTTFKHERWHWRRQGVTCECTYGGRHRDGGSLRLMLMVMRSIHSRGWILLAVAGAVICSVSPLLLCLTLPINCDLQPHESSSNGGERGSEWIWAARSADSDIHCVLRHVSRTFLCVQVDFQVPISAEMSMRALFR